MKLKVACHVHSDWSYDADWPLPKLAREFASGGYQALLMTEHDRGFSELRFQEHRAACANASTPDILLVPGIEYSDSSNVVHVLTWGIDSFLGEGLPTSELLDRVRANKGVAVFAHPERRQAWTRYDSSWARDLIGIEMWNRKADGWAPSEVAGSLLRGSGLVPFASLDFHRENQMFPLAMELDVEEPLSERSVVDCLRARQCRALAFSRPAENFLQGWRSSALYRLEKMRRMAAPFYRTVIRGS